MRVLTKLRRLIGLDFSLVIEHPCPYLEKPRALSKPAPLLQCARRDVPPHGKLCLREFVHIRLQQVLPRPRDCDLLLARRMGFYASKICVHSEE